ncbi:threonine synthase [Bythopirellula goksoeyrii]|uniref:Threonine synthase n=1 Tax=Bythopirellula goksoeyrii TaxID=1400387 RepID=A0A5B9QI51_9BACT|nr:threonine synthase [Bythopirellula goksoeyrii]QEG37260.1 Threonine synthase [Bythopirellula goksoeyrii]
MIEKLVCVNCGAEYFPQSADAPNVWMTCPTCGPAEGILDFRYDLEAVRDSWLDKPLSKREHNHWRYAELLPLKETSLRTDWQVGWTPIVDAERLATELDLERVLLKDEGRNPSASFKDRASSVGVAHAMEVGANAIACASTGNAATSLACHAALAGIEANIFVPHTAPEPKLAQLLVFGARVFSVEGSYDQAYQLCSSACEQFGWYNRNCAINPVLVEGKKTAGLEIAEQVAAYGGVPDWVAVSIGDGCTIAGIWKGLSEMHALGMIDRLPRLLGVQAKEVAPIPYALEHGVLPEPGEGTTMADSIDVQVPRNWRKAVNALDSAHGRVVCVSDEQILAAIRLAGRHGVFAEPAAAAALAGVVEAVDAKIIEPHESVLVMITGSGLKDIRSSIRAGGEPLSIKPDLTSVEAAVENAM